MAGTADRQRVRMLLVDDSRAMRAIVLEALKGDPRIEVAAVAGDGRTALEKIKTVKPDIVSLDVEMPDMDGLETLSAIRKDHRDLPVVMFSTLTRRGAEVTISALMQGANDYATKPPSSLGRDAARRRIRDDLVAKLLRLCQDSTRIIPRGVEARPGVDTPHEILPAVGARDRDMRPEIVLIASSTGGPNALVEILSAIPPTFPVPIAIVQHMPALFVRILARRLGELSSLPVEELTKPTTVTGATVWMAPGGQHMELVRRDGELKLVVRKGKAVNSCIPSADVLFESAAKATGARTLGVVLTGMGTDGKAGSAAIRSSGGTVFAQDRRSSVVWGMPGAVCDAGLADRIVPLRDMAGEIVKAVRGVRLGAARATDRAGQP